MIHNLKKYGLISPYRSKLLMERSIDLRNLNLKGLIILTEAASRNYVHTPIIAALAGADKVYALTRDSFYGKASDIADFTYTLAEFCGVRNKINIINEKSQKIVGEADIITNLGFVRPIDSQMVSWMKDTAVIPLMYEAWEFRTSDLDLSACRNRGIPVIGTNEDAQGLEVFKFCGPLCAKMLFDKEIEIYQCHIVIVSQDKFGAVIYQSLKALGAEVFIVHELRSQLNRKSLIGADAVIIADYTRDEIFIGHNGQISPEELKDICPGALVIQFAGRINISELAKYNIEFYPNKEVGSYRMGMTLAELGPKPIIDLHCAGLKVGEVAARARLKGLDLQTVEKIVLEHSPAQLLSFNNQ